MADVKSESQSSEEEDTHTRQKLEALRRAQEEAERQAQMHKKLPKRPDGAPPRRDGQVEAASGYLARGHIKFLGR